MDIVQKRYWWRPALRLEISEWNPHMYCAAKFGFKFLLRRQHLLPALECISLNISLYHFPPLVINYETKQMINQ